MAKKRKEKAAKKAAQNKKKSLDAAANARAKELDANNVPLGELRIPEEHRRLLEDFPGPKPKLPKKKTAYSGREPPIPPPALLDLVHNFLKDFKYIKAAHGVRTDNQKRPGHNMAIWKWTSDGMPNLLEVFLQWQEQNPGRTNPLNGDDPAPKQTAGMALGVYGSGPQYLSKNAYMDNQRTGQVSTSGSDSESDASKSQDSVEGDNVVTPPDTQDSGSDSGSDDDDSDQSLKIERIRPAIADAKLKNELLDSSASLPVESRTSRASPTLRPRASLDSDSTSSSSSSLSAKASTKRNKTRDIHSRGSRESSSKKRKRSGSSSSSDSSASSSPSSSSSSSSSSSDSETAAKKKRHVKKQAFGDEKDKVKLQKHSANAEATSQPIKKRKLSKSDASSDSDTSTASDPSATQPKLTQAPPANEVTGSMRQNASLETLAKIESVDATGITKEVTVNGVHGIDNNGKPSKGSKIKMPNVPFSRIPDNIMVDPRFGSNAYVPYDYAERSYADLSVTRGKGFTKEKNKKKRGQGFRGGAIDIGVSRGIKFED